MNRKRTDLSLAVYACLVFVVSTLVVGCDPPRRPEAAFVREIPWAGRGVWLKSDTHTHSSFSDGEWSPQRVAAAAVSHGCDVLAVTDHGDVGNEVGGFAHREAIEVARRSFPGLVLLEGVEWNVPPWRGRVHATVLFGEEDHYAGAVRQFRELFDDFGSRKRDEEFAAAAFEWLEERPSGPVVFLNHPSRKGPGRQRLTAAMSDWSKSGDVFAGFSGAPGHQRGDPIGAYTDPAWRDGRWDVFAAEVGGVWDELSRSGVDVWAARADSDFHRSTPDRTGVADFEPGEFSETWLYAPDRTASGALAAFRRGSFFAAHGHVVRQVEVLAEVPGLPRAARAGETVRVATDTTVAVRLEFSTPETDWEGRPNQIDRVELIAATADGADLLLSLSPLGPTLGFETDVTIPRGGAVLRARGRRENALEPDLCFYTNPIRFVTADEAGAGQSDATKAASRPDVSGRQRDLGRPDFRTGGLLAAILIVSSAAAVAFGTVPRARGETPEIESRPRRRIGTGWLAAAAVLVAGIVAASLTPFRFRSVPFGEAVTIYQDLLAAFPSPPGRIDFIANTIAFVPTAYALAAGFGYGTKGPLARFALASAVVGVCHGLSHAVEFAQVWAPGRVPSPHDVKAQFVGSLVGVGLWLSLGRTVSGWTTRLGSSTTPPTHKIAVMLRVYVIAYLTACWFPFDFRMPRSAGTVGGSNSADVWGPFAGEVEIVPIIYFGLLCVPLGWLGGGPAYHRSSAFPRGLLWVLGAETGQLFLPDRTFDVCDIVTGAAAIAVASRLRQFFLMPVDLILGTRDAVRNLYLRTATAAAAVPIFFQWYPFAISREIESVGERLSDFWAVPFSRQQASQYLSLIDNFEILFVIYLPAGWLLGRAAAVADRGRELGRSGAAYLTAGAAAAFSIEAGQAFFAGRSADVTDAVISTLGLGFGFFIAKNVAR